MQPADYAKNAKSTFTKTVVKVLKIVGTALAIINGFIQPLSSLVYGKLTDDLMVPVKGVNISEGNATNSSLLTQNSTKNLIDLTSGSQMPSAGLNYTGLQTKDNKGNTSQKNIPTRLVLTPETNPLYPPGYGYSIMPGLVRLQPNRSNESTIDKIPKGPSPADQERSISKYALYYCYLALATFVCSYGQMLSWNIASSKFLQDKPSDEENLDEEKDDKREVKQGEEEESDDGIGSRITIIIQNVANFASSMLVSFIQNWQLTLMMLIAGPIMASVMFYMNKLKSFLMDKVKFLLQKAKGVAKGAFSQVQTVAAFGGQDYEKNKFSSNLVAADKAAKIRSIVDAVRAGIMIVIAFFFLGLGFWFSAGLILDGTLTPGAFISIFMAIISSVLKLVNVGDAVQADNAKDDKKDENSNDEEEEKKPPDIIGRILEHLSNPEEVFKHYPNRPESMVKSSKIDPYEDNIYVEFTREEKHYDRCNMSENNTFTNSTKGKTTTSDDLPTNDKNANAKSSKKWNVKKFKENIKSKFRSKNETKNTNNKTFKPESNLRTKFSIEYIKERLTKCFGNAKSWLETKVLGQIKTRGISMEVIKLQIKQLPLIVMSLVGAVMTGMIAPGFSLLLSEILIVTADPERLKAERYKWAFKFVDLGVFIAIGSTIQKFSTSLSESRLKMGMKENSFNSAMNESEVPKTTTSVETAEDSSPSEKILLKKKIEEIEIEESEIISKDKDLDTENKPNIPGNKFETKEKGLNLLDDPNDKQAENMTEKMDEDASRSITSSFSLSDIGTKVSSSISTTMTMFIAFTNGWKMTLVVLAGLPIIGYAQSIQNIDPDEETINEKKKNEEENNGILSKLCKKFRGLTSSASSKVPGDFSSKYSGDILKPYRYAVKLLIATGLAFAIAESVTFLLYAGALRYGGYLVRTGEMTVESVMTVLMTVLFGGANSSNAPEEKSKTKSETLEEEQLDDVKVKEASAGKAEKLAEVQGEVEFHDVEFHHPEKKSVLMSGLNISVKSSETLVFLGTTDFNSNSIIALVERFYDPSKGSVTLDNIDIRNLDVRWLRSQMAVVSESGVLSHHSMADNLLIGDSEKHLTDEYLEDVSKETHLHEFVSSLPNSYNSLVGDDVILNHITKQKLAITRAIIRNPRILILNEFYQSYPEVQETLERLRLGRTCIIFARHLSTVKKADKVVIVFRGRVVEQGPREELMARRGILYHLMNTDLPSDIAPAL